MVNWRELAASNWTANCGHIEMQTLMAGFLIFQEKPESEFLFAFHLYSPNV